MVNRDENGIRYGYIAAQDLIGEVVDELMYGATAENLSYREAIIEETKRQMSEWEDECERLSVAAQEAGTDLVLDDFEPCLDDFDPMIEEPIVEGMCEDVFYRSSWMGGALCFFIFRSPMLGHFQECSPCVPGAGSLSQRDSDGVWTFDVPLDWRYKEPDDGKTFAERLEEHE